MNQDCCGSAFKKLKLAPKTLAIAAGAGLMFAGAFPAQAYNIQTSDGADDAVIVASTTSTVTVTSSVTVTSTVTVTSSVTVTSTVTVTSSVTVTSGTSGALPGNTPIVGTSFNQPAEQLDLSTTV